MPLTPRQLEVLNFIRRFADAHGYSPTLEEIAAYFSVSSVTIFGHVKALERKGFLRRTKHEARSIELIHTGFGTSSIYTLPLLGYIAAGRPIEAVADAQEIDISSMLIREKDCYVLQVRGDSMIDEQIRDGDYVIVERRDHAENGETVVALVNGNEATLKKFYRENGRVRLQPANPNMKPIYVTNVQVQGVVIGVLRKY